MANENVAANKRLRNALLNTAELMGNRDPIKDVPATDLNKEYSFAAQQKGTDQNGYVWFISADMRVPHIIKTVSNNICMTEQETHWTGLPGGLQYKVSNSKSSMRDGKEVIDQIKIDYIKETTKTRRNVSFIIHDNGPSGGATIGLKVIEVYKHNDRPVGAKAEPYSPALRMHRCGW